MKLIKLKNQNVLIWLGLSIIILLKLSSSKKLKKTNSV